MEPKYRSEAELCSEFITAASGYGWVCYPECSGWDILLVRDNIQIGIQAKMSWNIDVVGQCCPFGDGNPKKGPDFRCILIPGIPKNKRGWSSTPFRVTRRLRIWVLTGDGFGHAILGSESFRGRNKFEWNPVEHEWIPDHVPNLPAGVSSPVSLTKWKQAAMKVIATGDLRGFLTTDDFRKHGIDHRLFVQKGWIVEDGKEGRKKRYVLGGENGRPDERHPEYYQKIKNDILNESTTI